MNILRKLSLAAVLAAVAVSAAPGSARADASCSNLLTSKFNYLKQNGGAYNVEITVTKDPLADVTYSTGWVSLEGAYLYGNPDLAFSDRFNGNQNFNVNATESLQLWISETGSVWIYNNNYRYYIVSGQDMSCSGGLISKYVPGLGLVTVALRTWFAPIG
jgi:hypothetical protein